jgi:hypothetical protein
MKSSTRRTFTVFDAMVLIAATAVALAVIRVIAWDNRNEDLGPKSPIGILVQANRLNQLFIPIALTLSVALIFLRMLRPRPRLWRVFRQPGAAACTAVTIHLISSLFIMLGLLGPYYLIPHVGGRLNSPAFFLVGFFLFSVYFLPGVTVAAVWMILRLSGAWRPEPSWIDAAGRAFGFYFILNSGLSGLSYTLLVSP